MTFADLPSFLTALAEKEAGPGELRMVELPVVVEAGSVRAARDMADHVHILIPVAPGSPVRVDRRSRGVTIDRREFVVGGDRQIFADIYSERPELSDVFERLCSEMLDRIAHEPTKALEIAYEVLGRWRALLERDRPVSSEQLVEGLFGELWILRKIVRLDPSRSVTCWTGPSGATHDFESTAGSVEVKATTTREGRFAEIHGVQQLEPSTPERPLYLAFLRLAASPEGESITDLIASILAEGTDATEMDQLVRLTGWRAEGVHERFVVKEELYYTVDAAFPRIITESFTNAEVPSGVLRVAYQIDLSGAVPAPLGTAQVDSFFSELAISA